MAVFFLWRGRIRKIGPPSAASFARSIFSFSITSGMIRVPAILSPFFTGKSPWRPAIIISPREFTAKSFFRSIFKRPSPIGDDLDFPLLDLGALHALGAAEVKKESQPPRFS